MLHELLFALKGHSGHIFTVQNGKLKVGNSMRMLMMDEEAVLTDLLELGTHFIHVQEFLKSQRDIQMRKSQYVQYMCEILDEELKEYRKAIVRVEREMKEDSSLSLTFIQEQLHPFLPFLKGLSALVRDVNLQVVPGAKILSVIHEHSITGDATLEAAMLRIGSYCKRLLYQQTYLWALHGILIDGNGEFFIQKISRVTPQKSGEETQREREEEYERMGVKGNVTLVASQIPSFVPQSTADKILFLGRTISLFEASNAPHVEKDVWSSLLCEEQERFQEKFAALAQTSPQLQDEAFHRLVDSIFSVIMKHLQELIMKEGELVKTLKLVKDFYLVGRGDLFLGFLSSAAPLLSQPPSPDLLREMNLLLQLEGEKLGLNESILERFSLVFSDPLEGDGHTRTKQGPVLALDLLAPQLDVHHLCGFLLTPHALGTYARLFRFLIRIHWAQIHIKDAWAMNMSLRNDGEVMDMEGWRCLHGMTFLVKNLQSYIQADVVESHMARLFHGITQEAADYDDMKHFHESALAGMSAHAFLLNPHVEECLETILSACVEFSLLVRGEDQRGRKKEEIRLKEDEFRKRVWFLFELLMRLASSQGPLLKFLLRLDFNSFFSLHPPAFQQ